MDTISPVFEAAANDLGKPRIDSEVVKAVWQRILPGLLEVNSKHVDEHFHLFLPMISRLV